MMPAFHSAFPWQKLLPPGVVRHSLVLQGWLARPPVMALVLGLVSACGLQPLALWPLALIGMAGLIALLARCTHWRKAAWLGWLFALAHFALANNWIATAFTYQADLPPVLGWVAVPLLALYLAIYPALAAGVAYGMAQWARLHNPMGWRWLLVFAACWIVSEWLRGWVLTGYPWNPFGVVLLGGYETPGLARMAPFLGTYALSGLAVLIAGAGLILWQARRLWFGIFALVIGVFMLWPDGKAQEGSLPFTLVQPDLRQDHINDPALFEDQFARIAKLSLPHEPGQVRLVMWPESGVPDYLRDGYPMRYYHQMTAQADPAFARARIGRAIGSGSLLLTGAVDLDIAQGRAVGARNAVTAIDGAGNIRAGYAKAHLVPFGEYLPLRGLLEPLGAARFVAGTIDFLPGPGPRTLDLGPWGKAGMQICYEIIFSGKVVQKGTRPDYIFNPSNDGWFGRWGPPQHLAQARLRAIEEGLPVLRATTTGISAVIDAHGVVRHHVPTHRAQRIDGLVPPALAPTLFAQAGNILPLGWALVLLIISLVARRRSAR